MSVRMRVDEVHLLTPSKNYKFDFRSPCTVIDGPVGTGKSSLLELIKHVLGGNAVLTPAVRKHVDRVRARIRLGDETLILSRGFGRSGTNVSVLFADENTIEQEYPVRHAEGRETISDLLLARLGMPSVRIPRSRSNSTAASMALTFNDVFSYLYVEQQNIDRSIAHHTESFREPKRRAVFELMLGLASSDQLEAETRLGAVKDAQKAAVARVDTIGGFLEAAQVESETELADAAAVLGAEARDAEAGLTNLRTHVAKLTRAHEALNASVREAEQTAARAMEEVERLRSQLAGREQLLAQLQLEATRRSKNELATMQLGPLDFVVCPRCMQDLDEARAAANECTVCLQPVASVAEFNNDPDDYEPSEQEAELENLINQSKRNLADLERRAVAENHRLRTLKQDLDEVTSNAVTPRFQEIEVLSSKRARALSEIEAKSKSLELRRDHRRLESRVEELKQERENLEEVILQSRARDHERSEMLDDLDTLFDETVRALETPHARSAELHRTNYLPLIDDEPFDTISVAGGLKTVAAVAYHLSLLSFCMFRQETLLPSILIIDSPRKNLGQNEEDQRLGARIYDRIRAIVESKPGAAQIIVADNDPPSDTSWAERIELGYDRPLLAEAGHPGEEAARTGKLETVGKEVVR